MKKLILFLITITIFLGSCAEKDAFTINGKLPSGEYDGQTVYLKSLDSTWSKDPKTYVTIDTASIVNGQFVFKGIAKEGSVLHFIVLENAPEKIKYPVPVVVEPGQINVSLDTISTIGGTALNDAYQKLSSAFSSEPDSIAKTELISFVKANVQNQVGTYAFVRNSYFFSADEMRELLPLVKPEYKARVQKLENRVKALDNTAIGKQFVDIKGKTPDGKDIALSDFAGKGKYVLIDFWASWCPPCRAEMPNLVEAYQLYKDKGLEIVGFSLDKANENWVKGIEMLNITWPQISELNFWDSKPVADYGVASIPHTVLLDKEGKIIARGLEGKELQEKLSELLK